MRRNTRKNTKKASRSLLILLIIAIVVVAINVGIFSEKTGKATVNVAKDAATEMPFTEEQVVQAAVDVAMNGYVYPDDCILYNGNTVNYYLDCSTYVSTVIQKLGGKFDRTYQYTASSWESGAVPFTYNGQTVTAQLVTSATAADGQAWTSAIDPSVLKPGDIISGHGHMFIYVGNAENQDGIIQKLQSTYGQNISTITSTSANDSIGKLNYDASNTSRTHKYWIIEGNVSADTSPRGNGPLYGDGVHPGTQTNINMPYLSNYNWAYRIGNKSLESVRVYRITHEEETYTGGVGFYKYVDQNGNNTWDNGEPALSGATFSLYKDQAKTNQVTKDGSPYIVTTGNDGSGYFENIDLGTETSGTFYLFEESVPSGYVKHDGAIQVTVSSSFDKTNLTSFHQNDVGNTEVKNKGSVGLYKYVDTNGNGQWDSGEPALAGAKFKLAKNSAGTDFVQKNSADYEVTTGDNGTAMFTDIELGTATTANYYLVETHVPTGYTMKERIIPATVKTSGYDLNNISTLIQVGNDEVKYKGKVGVYKYEDVNGNGKWDEGEPALKGASFKLATNSEGTTFVKNGNVDYEVTTGDDGKALFENIDLGTATEKTFYLKETASPEGFKLIEETIEVKAKKDGVDLADISTLVQLGNQKKIYDLALRKYITAVKDGATGETTEVTDRIPKITIPENFNTDECTTLEYNHKKDPVTVHTTDIVTYNIEVFNEGPEDAYANIIKDDIPEGLEFVPYTEGDGSINDKFGWELVDEDDNPVEDLSKAKYIITNYLDIDSEGKNLIKAFDPETMDEPDSRIVKVQFKVTEPTTSNRILINHAQISKETDADGKVVTDRDSTPNEWLGEDDEDYEQVRVLYFDLALRKWVVEAIVTKDGKETIYQTGHKAEDDPESVVKVDLKKSDLSKVTVKFKYKIRIKNEGEIAGEAKTVRDDVPAGLKFVQADNQDWREENGKIVTNKLANVTLEPGESTEMEIILTWINGEENMGVMTNISEIEEDHNVYGAHDIDSTPGNKKPKEDDIDDAPVMLAITTGSEVIKYIALGVGIVAFIGISGIIIKRRVLNY